MKPNLGGWALSIPDERGEMHCVPINDLKEHIDEDCECKPVRDEDVHNSFDGREEFETGERSLS